jgi:hypothetical protein
MFVNDTGTIYDGDGELIIDIGEDDDEDILGGLKGSTKWKGVLNS